MGVEPIAVLIILFVCVVLFLTERLPVDLVAMVVMAALMLSGILSPADALSGFSSPATVTVAAMFVLSEGVLRTGLVHDLGRRLSTLLQRGFRPALLALMLFVGVLSAFINNTAAVALLIPVILAASRRASVSPTRLLMPLSFASMFGGVCTLIGTSTNILVDAIAREHGQRPFGIFEVTPLGLIFFGAGVAYMLAVGTRLLPERASTRSARAGDFGLKEYVTDVVVLPGARSVGLPLADTSLVRDLDVLVLDIFRDGHRLESVGGNTVLEPNDVLRLRCDVSRLAAIRSRVGVELQPEWQWHDDSLSVEEGFLEVAVAPGSPLVDRTLEEVQFRNRYGATVVAIRQRDNLVGDRIKRTRLQAGDLLLVKAPRAAMERVYLDRDFIVLSEVEFPHVSRRGAALTVGVLMSAILAAAFGLVTITASAVTAAVLLALLRVVSMQEAYRAVDWKVIFLLAGVIPLGLALEKTGVARMLADLLIANVGPYGPVAVLSVLYLITTLLTEAMSNNAAAALLAPIALSAASSLGVDPRPLLIAIMFAASSSFMTPVGYQTNTMIYAPGNYRFADFLRVGTALNIIFWLLATLLIPRLWPFQP